MNFATILSDDEDTNEAWFAIINGKKIYEIIYKNAVLLHEKNLKYNPDVRKFIIEQILREFPNFPKEYPIFFTRCCSCINRICLNKKGISEMAYSYILDDIFAFWNFIIFSF